MSLQVLRGRALQPPLRPVCIEPGNSTGPTLQEAARVQAPAPQAAKGALRFPVNPDTRAFYRRFYPGTSTVEWNDWRWQIRNRIRTLDELARIFRLSDDEHDAVGRHQGALPVGITPYYASLMGLTDASEPLRRTHIMTGDEYVRTAGRGRRSAGRGP